MILTILALIALYFVIAFFWLIIYAIRREMRPKALQKKYNVKPLYAKDCRTW